MALETRILDSVDAIPPAAWDRLVDTGNPFMEHAFLRALETSGCVGPGTGWHPHYVSLLRGGDTVAIAPAFLKTDSYGEFIFDWQWADAFHRAGIPYYPKLTVAAPFTPATGGRFLVAAAEPAATSRELAAALAREGEARDCSSVHVLFCTEGELQTMAEAGAQARLSYQFHWENRGYETFADFLADLRSSKRKQIRRERRAIAETPDLEIQTLVGDDVKPEHLDAMWTFYQVNQAGKFGQTYLNRAWFEEVADTMSDRLVMTMARSNGRWIGGTFNFYNAPHLFGRYWGTISDVEFLHFECCYYRLIDFAIEHGFDRFEAGAQGEHKFLRGFVTRPTWSGHWILYPGARDAIADYLVRERAHNRAVIAHYNQQSPLKHIRAQSRDPKGSSPAGIP